MVKIKQVIEVSPFFFLITLTLESEIENYKLIYELEWSKNI